MGFRKNWRYAEREPDDFGIKTMIELFFIIAAVFMIIVVLLFLIPTEKQSPPGVSVWPPGTPLRIEARRDFNLLGGPLRNGNCMYVDGQWLSRGGFGAGASNTSEETYRNRPHECSGADHDIHVRFTDRDGNVVESRSDRNNANVESGFRSTLPKNKETQHFGKQKNDHTYGTLLGSSMHRFEEMTYAHRFLEPGTYSVNIHLSSDDHRLKGEEVLASVFVVLYEGTPDEIVVFNDRVPLLATNADTREQTVVTFEIDAKGQLVEGSVDLITQVHIAEA